MPFGAETTKEGVRFALWAPSASNVELVRGSRRDTMPAIGQGWYKLVVADAKAGDAYAFAIDGAETLVPDPAARFKPDDKSQDCVIVDPRAYDWRDGAWKGRPWHEVVLSEVHVGTASREGTYAGLAAKLDHFKDTGITAIELMPIAETPGTRTWGYDGVLPFAPNNDYGTPDELKALIDKAHQAGVMVFLDVVYNHFGPSGNYLHSYAEGFFTERHHTPWGAAINFDGRGEASDVVREFFIQNALYWLGEYHFDGLRFDAVHAIIDDGEKHFLDELAERVRETYPDRHVHLVLENEKNEASRLGRDGDNRALSFDAQWDDDIHHCWHVLLTGENEGYYGDFGGDTIARLGRCLAEGFAYQGDYSKNLKHERGEKTAGVPPQAFVAFLQNHDQIGNRALGERLTSLTDPAKLRLARAALLLSPQIPMLFMGDEWGATTPFQFFVNFDDEALQQAVRDGRSREFQKFAAFSSGRLKVPDPTALETFDRSKLDWSETSRDPFRSILAEMRGLLASRQRDVVPLVASGFIESSYKRLEAGGLEVVWRFEDGTLMFFANFAPAPLQVSEPGGMSRLWRSDGIGDSSVLPSWTGMFLKSADV